jgi:hypothetical protein
MHCTALATAATSPQRPFLLSSTKMALLPSYELWASSKQAASRGQRRVHSPSRHALYEELRKQCNAYTDSVFIRSKLIVELVEEIATQRHYSELNLQYEHNPYQSMHSRTHAAPRPRVGRAPTTGDRQWRGAACLHLINSQPTACSATARPAGTRPRGHAVRCSDSRSPLNRLPHPLVCTLAKSQKDAGIGAAAAAGSWRIARPQAP